MRGRRDLSEALGEHTSRNSTESPVGRRKFLAAAGVYTWLAGASFAVVGALRSAVPSVLPDPSSRFRIGRAGDYTPGMEKEFPEENVIVYRDAEGVYAISKVCTHLGCIVMQSEEGFQCPCHGSRFAPDGKVLNGPAPRDLDWLALDRTPDGQLIVDKGKVRSRGTKTRLA